MHVKKKHNSTLMSHVVEGSWVPGQIIFVCTLAYYMQYKTYLATNLTANCSETYVEMIDITLATY